MLAIGALVAVQTQINGDLAAALGGGATAGLSSAMVSFGSGFVLLCLAAVASRSMRRGLTSVRGALRAGQLHPWQVLGGCAGGFLVATQGLTVSTIGVALFTVALVGGQTASGLLVDRLGLSPSGPQAISALRVVGAALTIAAVALSASERFDGPNALGVTGLALALLPLVAGLGIAWQQAVNGRVSLTGGPWAATWINFTAGSTLLAFATIVTVLVNGPTQSLPGTWWLYLGGPIGVVFISMAAVLVRVHGVLVLGLCTVSGQVASALVIDHLIGAGSLGRLTAVGAVITVAGVVLAGVGTWRGSRPGSRT
ncbi:DMT family transporter [soil metagenome]